MRKILLGLALAATFLVARPALAQNTPAKKGASDAIKLPTPAEVKQLQAFPTEFQLIGEDDSRQLVLTGLLTAGGNQDLSGDAQYDVADAKVVKQSSIFRLNCSQRRSLHCWSIALRPAVTELLEV